MKNIIIGLLFLLLAGLIPMIGYFTYCALLPTSCSIDGLAGAIIGSGVIIGLVFLVFGFYIFDKKPLGD